MKILLMTCAEPKQRHGLSMIEKRFPLGLGSLAAVLEREGHYVELQDRFLLGPVEVDKRPWDLVGIYISTPCFDDARHLITTYKAAGYRVAVGGPHVSLFPHTVDDADYLCIGEGEHAILDMLHGVAPHISVMDRIINLDQLPFIDYGWFRPHQAYCRDMYFRPGLVFNMNTSRGCPFACSFCDVKRIWTRKYASFSPCRVQADAAQLKVLYRVDGVYFREDNFMARGPASVMEIAKGLNKLHLFWACEARADSLQDLEFVRELAANGCAGFYIGIESGSQRMLEVFNKGVTVEQIDRALDNCRVAGVKVLGSFIVGHPEELGTDMRLTEDLIARHVKVFCKVTRNPYREFSHYEKYFA